MDNVLLISIGIERVRAKFTMTKFMFNDKMSDLRAKNTDNEQCDFFFSRLISTGSVCCGEPANNRHTTNTHNWIFTAMQSSIPMSEQNARQNSTNTCIVVQWRPNIRDSFR